MSEYEIKGVNVGAIRAASLLAGTEDRPTLHGVVVHPKWIVATNSYAIIAVGTDGIRSLQETIAAGNDHFLNMHSIKQITSLWGNSANIDLAFDPVKGTLRVVHPVTRGVSLTLPWRPVEPPKMGPFFDDSEGLVEPFMLNVGTFSNLVEAAKILAQRDANMRFTLSKGQRFPVALTLHDGNFTRAHFVQMPVSVGR